MTGEVIHDRIKDALSLLHPIRRRCGCGFFGRSSRIDDLKKRFDTANKDAIRLKTEVTELQFTAEEKKDEPTAQEARLRREEQKVADGEVRVEAFADVVQGILGDCWFLSSAAGHELTVAEAREPTRLPWGGTFDGPSRTRALAVALNARLDRGEAWTALVPEY